MKSHKAIVLTALMVLSVFAMPMSAAAQTVDSADRTVDTTEVQPGDVVTVTVDVTATETGNISVTEEFSPAFADVSLTDLHGTIPAAQAAGNEGVTLAYQGEDSVSVTYEVTIPDDAEAGDTFTIEGSASVDGNAADTGTTTLTVPTDGGNGEEPPAEPSAPAPSDVDTIYQGEELTVDVSGTSVGSGDILQIRQGLIGEDGDTLAATATVDENGMATFSGDDTAELAAEGVDRYHFFQSSGAEIDGSQFEVVKQDLTAESYGDVYYDNEAPSDNGVTISSDNIDLAGGSFNVTIASDDLDQDELNEVFGGAASAHGDEKIMLTVDSAEKDFDVDFSGYDYGTYNFTVESLTSNAEDTFDIEYAEAGEVSASFADTVFSQERGDYAEFTVDLQNTESATVHITDGSGEYESELTVTDSNDGEDADDGQVTVQMNTFLAGGHGDAYSPADGADSVTVDSDSESSIGDYRLAAGSYDLTVTAGGEEQDVATLSLEERSTTGISSIVAPSSADFGSADAITNGSELSEVAFGDHLALEVEASGVFTYLNDDVNAQGMSITFSQENFEGQYGNAPTFDVSGSAFDLVEDADNNRFFVTVDTDALDNVDAGDEYSVTFEINGTNNPYVADGETESVSTTVTFLERTSSFGVVEAPYQVLATDDTEVRGTSNLAPGSEITVQALKSGDFLRQDTSVEVMEDGTWTATFDFADRQVGEEFDLSLKRAGNTDAVDAVFSDTAEWETSGASEELQQRVNELETLLSETMDELEQKNATIEELRTQLNESGGASQELLDQKNATIEDLNQQLAQAESDLLNSTTTIADLNSEIEALNLSVRTLEADNADLESQLESLQSTLDEKNSTIEDQQSTIDEQKSTISDLQSQLEEAQQTTTTSGPGFTAVLALVALMGAALLAVRRKQ
ncbi:BGTF surface domain-containing protein [Halorhabdus tiamatea]|nr:BGTF surface domain-containing protein [Halorhabdus tiamatea]